MTDKKSLSPSTRKQLLGRSHRLNPVVVIGHAGPSEAVVEQIKHVLKTHDLIKIRIQAEDREAVQAVAEEVAAKADATLVTKIGKIAVLYRPQEELDAADRGAKGVPAADVPAGIRAKLGRKKTR